MFNMLYISYMGTIVIRKVPDKIHHDLKVICAQKDISMNQLLKDLIKKYVEENKGKWYYRACQGYFFG